MKSISQTQVLVTGASGFLGSHLVERLSKDGYKVFALLRRHSNVKYLKDAQNIKFLYGDLVDCVSLKNATQGMDVVIHCAALMSNYDWLSKSEYSRINCLGAKNIFLAAESSLVKQFIHISTVGVLGGSNTPVPKQENDSYGRRLSKYEWSKCEAEQILLDYSQKSNIALTIVRPAQLYGPRMVYGWLSTLNYIKCGKFRIIGKGESLIHLTYIDDVIEGITRLILNPDAFGHAFHFAGPEAVSLKKLFFTLAEYLKAPMPGSIPYTLAYCISTLIEYIPGFIKPKSLSLLSRHRVRFFKENHVYDINKARILVGYNPVVDLETGIKKMVDWFRQNRYLDFDKER